MLNEFVTHFLQKPLLILVVLFGAAVVMAALTEDNQFRGRRYHEISDQR